MNLAEHPGVTVVDDGNPAEGCELVCVLGGDGTILRGAEVSRGTGAPLLGVNLGHVGFLAEAEREDIDATVEHIVAKTYSVEERMTLEVTAHVDGEPGLHELGAQRGHRREGQPRTHARGGRRDRRPPAHDLGVRRGGRARPRPAPPPTPSRPAGRWSGPTSRRCCSCRSAPTPCSPDPSSSAPARTWPSRWCPTPWAPVRCGATAGVRSTCRPVRRIEVVRSQTPVRLARLSTSPFTDRLVAKFDLSIHGWRGEARREDRPRCRCRRLRQPTGAAPA